MCVLGTFQGLDTFVALLCCKDQTKPTEPAEPAAVQTTKLPYK